MKNELKYEMPSLEKEFLEVRKKKQKYNRTGIGIPLRVLSQSDNISRLFGDTMSEHLASLSHFDARRGVLSDRHREDIRAIASIINETATERLNTDIKFISAEELEKAIVSGDPAGLGASVANRLLDWKKAQPLDRARAWERLQLDLSYPAFSKLGSILLHEQWEKYEEMTSGKLGISQKALTGVEEVAAAGAFVGAIASIVGLTYIIGLLLDALSGSELEQHYDPFRNMIIARESYLHVPWRWVCIGKNNQSFVAQYKVQVAGGILDELRVTFRIDLSGGGFDRLNYPIEAAAWTLDKGAHYPSLKEIRSTRYQQIHEIVLENVCFLVICVNGKVHYGGDGMMTDAGLVPRGTAIKDGHSIDFGKDDSVWRYGMSV